MANKEEMILGLTVYLLSIIILKIINNFSNIIKNNQYNINLCHNFQNHYYKRILFISNY